MESFFTSIMGVRIPRIIYGTAWKKTDTQRLVQMAIQLTANPRVLAHATITALASTHKRTPPQILFRYLTQTGVVPLTGTRSETHMREDLSIFEFELTAEERRAVDKIFVEKAAMNR
jgi:diketogulonate reductase-like aldo/keto reductase